MEHPAYRKDALFEIGFVKQQGNWKSELADKAGLDVGDINWALVDKTIRQSFSDQGVFRGYNGKPTTEPDAKNVLLPTGIKCADGSETICAKFWRGKQNRGWMGVEFLTEKEYMDQFGPALYRFANCVGPWTAELASKAAPEPWTLKSSRRDYDVLFKYLCYTFEKLQEDGQVVELDDCAAFHTGLFTASYEPIYAYFVPNPNQNRQKWKLAGFHVKNKGYYGTEMAQRLTLPTTTANWFKNPSRLFCDPGLLIYPGPLDIDIDHCIIENASRLPLYLIKRATQDPAVIDAILAPYDNEDLQRTSVIAAIRGSSDYKKMQSILTNELIGAVELARMKVLSDYTAAVPQFYPDHRPGNDGFGFLLPLSFDMEKPEEVNCALVIQPKADGQGYNGETILTPDMAYSNARLLRRPNAHWLTDRLKEEKTDSISSIGALLPTSDLLSGDERKG